MLIPIVDIPLSGSLNEEVSASLVTFISHIGILGPVLLKVQNISSEQESLSLELVQSATQSTACYVEGLSIDNDDLATKLLDRGAHIVFFKTSDEEALQSKVLASLPRTRVGLNCSADTITVANMLDIVGKSREYSGNFLFRSVDFPSCKFFDRMCLILDAVDPYLIVVVLKL